MPSYGSQGTDAPNFGEAIRWVYRKRTKAQPTKQKKRRKKKRKLKKGR